MTNFKAGDLVRIKREWCNSEEESHKLFVIVKDSVWEKEQRCCIKQIDCKLAIVPSERVDFDMLISTGININEK